MKLIFVTVLVQLYLLSHVYGQPYGALYHIDNSNSNNVLTYSLTGDGEPVYSKTFPTGGKGTSKQGGDPLISQGSVATFQNLLAVVNAGDNTVSLFNINPTDPTIVSLAGSPVSSGGDYPVSLAFSPSGQTLCVLNSGINNGFRCYQVATTGLTILSSWDRSTGVSIATNPPTSTSLTQILFSADGSLIFIAGKGLPTTNSLFVYTITSGNVLSASATRYIPTGANTAFPMTLVGNNALLLVDPTGGLNVFDYTQPNALVSGSYLPLNNTLYAAPCWTTYSPVTNTYFVIAAGTPAAVEISISSSLVPTLVQSISLPRAPSLDATVSVINGKSYLYVISPGAAGSPSTVATVALSQQGATPSSLNIINTPLPVNHKNIQGLASWTQPVCPPSFPYKCTGDFGSTVCFNDLASSLSCSGPVNSWCALPGAPSIIQNFISQGYGVNCNQYPLYSCPSSSYPYLCTWGAFASKVCYSSSSFADNCNGPVGSWCALPNPPAAISNFIQQGYGAQC